MDFSSAIYNYADDQKILQEVAAARNVLFKCGNAELQTGTFLAGLEAFQLLDNWQVRSRILSFLLLIKASAFRENLKGQTHLDIEPLAGLIERFHAHDATDARDKIYALWGLCSDSGLMSSLRPDYKKSLKELLEDLGKIIFGEGAMVTAAHTREMMFARTAAFDMGQVDEVFTASGGNLWQDTQKINITSVRASRFLGTNPQGNLWTMKIEMRATSEQILEGDYVMFLPQTSRIIFVRPARYFFRILAVVHSSTVDVDRPESSQLVSRSEWWSLWLNSIHEVPKVFPFLWSWETANEQDDDEALLMMNNPATTQSGSDEKGLIRIRSQATAMSDVANLFMELDEYHHAENLFADLVLIYEADIGRQYEDIVGVRNRMNDASNREAINLKARQLLANAWNPGSASIVTEICALIILRNVTFHSERSNLNVRGVLAPVEVWIALASKAISKGVNKEMLLEAVQCLRSRGNTRMNSSLDDSHSITKATFTDYHNIENGKVAQTLVEFLLELADDNIYISAEELLAAARRDIKEENLMQLAKRSDYPLQNLPQILEALRSRQALGFSWGPFVTELGDRSCISPNAVNVAVKWDAHALSGLLKAARGTPVVTPAAFTIAMENPSRYTGDIIKLLVQHAEPGCIVPQDLIVSIIRGTPFQSVLSSDDLVWLFIALIERTDIIIDIDVKTLANALLFKPITSASSRINLLRYRTDCHFGTKLLQIMKRDLSEALSAESLQILEELNEEAGPIKPEELDEICANDVSGYASFINLVRYRRDFEITEALILKTATEKKKASAQCSIWLYVDETAWNSLLVIDRCTAFLIRHAESGIVDALVASAALKDIATSRGLPLALEALQGRSSGRLGHFDVLHTVAKLCQVLQQPSSPGRTNPTVYSVLKLTKTLAVMEHEYIPDHIKREIFRLAQGDSSGIRDVVDTLLMYNILDADTIESWKREQGTSGLGHPSWNADISHTI